MVSVQLGLHSQPLIDLFCPLAAYCGGRVGAGQRCCWAVDADPMGGGAGVNGGFVRANQASPIHPLGLIPGVWRSDGGGVSRIRRSAAFTVHPGLGWGNPFHGRTVLRHVHALPCLPEAPLHPLLAQLASRCLRPVRRYRPAAPVRRIMALNADVK